jgi:GT2 family glycosyltransferase/ubiquinone/menaquinone biosynthesis C-methylase UbiE
VTKFRPLEVVHADLSDGLEGLLKQAPPEDHDVYAVFWDGDIPLGYRELTHAQFDRPAALAHLVAEAVTLGVGDLLYEDGFEATPPGMRTKQDAALRTEDLLAIDRPLEHLRANRKRDASLVLEADVSVVVCTRERAGELQRCLSSILATTTRPREIIVVDNAPWTTETRDIVDSFPNATYVAEARPGLSRARNAGIRHASGEIIAFTDDDTVVHENWLSALVGGFDRPDVMCVTGLVLPAELRTPAQVAFEKDMGGFSQGYRPIEFDLNFFEHYKSWGVPVWKIGAGANMAIRRQAFEFVGNFDERLGAGAAGCSEDSEFWYRLLAEGWVCRYEPAAVVSHYHRSDVPGLRRQARAYIRGHVAALFAQYARYGHRGNLRRAFVTMPRWLLLHALREVWLPNRRASIAVPYLGGYMGGFKYLPLTVSNRRANKPTDDRGGRKTSRRAFLRRNPYPHPLSEGLFYREKMRAVHRISPEGPFERILEVGGGQSGLSAELYPRAEVVSIDLNAEYATSPLNRRPGSQFLAADATRLPFSDESFDLVTMFDVLEHVPDDEQAVAEALRVLRPGKFILLTSPNERWRFPYFRVLKPLCPTEDEIMAEWGHARRGYSLEELQVLFKAAPLAVAEYNTPLMSVGHDLAFSKLPGKARAIACAALSPLTWAGYWLHRAGRSGVERGTSWRPKDG